MRKSRKTQSDAIAVVAVAVVVAIVVAVAVAVAVVVAVNASSPLGSLVAPAVEYLPPPPPVVKNPKMQEIVVLVSKIGQEGIITIPKPGHLGVGQAVSDQWC